MEAGTTLQRHLSDYLKYELYHTLGAYGVAERCHHELAEELGELRGKRSAHGPKGVDPNSKPPVDHLEELAAIASHHNWDLGNHRHGNPRERQDPAGQKEPWPYREPETDELPLTWCDRFRVDDGLGIVEDRKNPWQGSRVWERIPQFYSEAIRALKDFRPEESSRRLAGAKANAQILAYSVIEQMDHGGRAESQRDSLTAELRLMRYCHRLRHADATLFPHLELISDESEQDRLKRLYNSTEQFRTELYCGHLSQQGDSLPLFIVRTLAEAHLSLHAIEAWKLMCLGELGAAHTNVVVGWLDDELARCIELNTFAYSISRTAPWLFAADENERAQVFADSTIAWEHTRPARGMWIASQIGLLAMQRRAAVRALNGDRTGAYNDYHKLQRLIRDAERRLRLVPIQVDGALDFLGAMDAQAHHRVGELYRAENAHRPARKHFNVAYNLFERLRRSAEQAPQPLTSRQATRGQVPLREVLLHSRRLVELMVSYGKASYEMGHHKEALCWHLRAWRDFLKLLAADSETTAYTVAIDEAISWLERVRYEPELIKHELSTYLKPVIEQVGRVTVSRRYGALAGDILVRLGHLLLVMNLPSEKTTGRDLEVVPPERFALVCLERARKCDPHSSVIVSDLIKAALRLSKQSQGGGEIITELPDIDLSAVEVGRLWTGGGRDFERLARAAEYLTLHRMWANRSRPPLEPSGAPASAMTRLADLLLRDFYMNTDSVNVRTSRGYALLMKGKRETSLPRKLQHSIEFVCMRRYSSVFPMLPRPMAFRALCGGYFVRLHRSAGDGRDGVVEEQPRPYGVVIDPGVDFVENLYRAGYSIGDIDMVVTTHDHVDHVGALDTLISLIWARARTRSGEAGSSARSGPVTFLLSPSLALRPSENMNRSQRHREAFRFRVIGVPASHKKRPEDAERFRKACEDQGIDVLASDGDTIAEIEDFPSEFEIVIVPTDSIDGHGHRDLGDHASLSICVRPRGAKAGGVAFTSDTPPPPQCDDAHIAQWRKRWRPILRADVMVAHLSDAPLTELRKFAPSVRAGEESGADVQHLFEQEEVLTEIHEKLVASGTVGQGELEYGLRLLGSTSSALKGPVPIVGGDLTEWRPSRSHSFLSGVVRWAEAYERERQKSRRGPGVFVIGELGEELGTMRIKVASHIHTVVFADEAGSGSRALSGDVGLTVLVDCEERAARAATVRVLCATCSLDTDRVPEEQFHEASYIYEACVKGENEGIFYNCGEHAPNGPGRALFLEQLERFDVFGR